MKRETQIVAITSSKGGTGKSIIAASIAYILSHCGFKTLLIDMDLFTHGLTFYALAEYPRDASYSTSDLFKHDREAFDFQTTLIPNSFTKNNLEIAPSIRRTRRPKAELELNERYSNLEGFLSKTKGFFYTLTEKFEFDFIIVDTRGGTDITSVGSALASGSYIVVTEADKPSWDMGRLLIDTIDSSQNKLNTETDRLGFIINKNVLPSEAIEAFLRKEWQTAHLATIPLDENAVRYFQEDKIPVAEKIGCPFSKEILGIIRKTFVSERWSKENISCLESLENLSSTELDMQEGEKKAAKSAERFSVLMRVYGTVLSTMVLSLLAYTLVSKRLETSYELMFVVIAALLIFFMTASDPKFLVRVLEVLFGRKRRDKEDPEK